MSRLLFCLFWATALALVVQSAYASNDAELSLDRAIQKDPNLAAIFSRSKPTSISEFRAEIVADDGVTRYAAVTFRDNPNGGKMFCHAALSRPESTQFVERVTRKIGDQMIAEEILRHTSSSATMRQIQDKSLAGIDGYGVVACQVALYDLIAPVEPAIDPETISATSYSVAKRLYFAGRREEALERLRQLRSTPIYNNAVLFVVAILSQSNPDMALKLRKQGVDLDKVTDNDALTAYADAMAAIGSLEDEKQARNLISQQK